MKALVFKDPDKEHTKVVDLKENEYPVHESMVWMDAPKDCEQGWILVDGVITAPPEPPERTYEEKRRKEYPISGDQLDDLYHAGIFSAEMTAKLKKVKDKYPKG